MYVLCAMLCLLFEFKFSVYGVGYLKIINRSERKKNDVGKK